MRAAAETVAPTKPASPQKQDQAVFVEVAPSSPPLPPELCALSAAPAEITALPPVSSDHNDLPPEYWTDEEYGYPEYVADFWRVWSIEQQAPTSTEANERVRDQQTFAQTFMTEKQPDFFRALNAFQRAFDVKIQRSLNGFVKLVFPEKPELKGFFHVPHPDSDIGRDAMWAREIHRCLVEMGLGRAE